MSIPLLIKNKMILFPLPIRWGHLSFYLIKFISTCSSGGANHSTEPRTTGLVSLFAVGIDNVTGPCLIRCGSNARHYHCPRQPLFVIAAEETLNWKVGKIICNKCERRRNSNYNRLTLNSTRLIHLRRCRGHWMLGLLLWSKGWALGSALPLAVSPPNQGPATDCNEEGEKKESREIVPYDPNRHGMQRESCFCPRTVPSSAARLPVAKRSECPCRLNLPWRAIKMNRFRLICLSTDAAQHLSAHWSWAYCHPRGPPFNWQRWCITTIIITDLVVSFLYTNNIEIQTNFYGRLNPPSVANQSPDRYILDTLNLFADDQEVWHVVDSQAAQCRAWGCQRKWITLQFEYVFCVHIDTSKPLLNGV